MRLIVYSYTFRKSIKLHSGVNDDQQQTIIAVTGQEGEESPATVENETKAASRYFARSPLIPAICKVYILEYLSNFDDDAPDEWADRLQHQLLRRISRQKRF